MPKPLNDDLLNRAAELRAAGSTWEAVAAKIHRAADAVRKWPRDYADRWKIALREAERRLVCEAAAESVLVLRTLLRSEDEKVCRDAARSLTDLRLDWSKLELAAGSESAQPLTSDSARILAFLDGHPDEELARLAANFSPVVAASQPAAAERCPVDGAA